MKLGFIALIALIAVGSLGCEELDRRRAHAPSGFADDGTTASPTFWLNAKTNIRAPGPRTYISRSPILLADGTYVVCISTLEALWCKEAAE